MAIPMKFKGIAIFFLKKHPAETDAIKNREGDPLILLSHPHLFIPRSGIL